MKIVCFLFLCCIASAVAGQDSLHAQLVGKYKFPSGSIIAEADIVFENGVLVMTSSAGTSSLELIKGDSFNVVSFNGIAVFKRNEAKKVIGVHVDASGYVLDGVKDGVSIKTTIPQAQTAAHPENTTVNAAAFLNGLPGPGIVVTHALNGYKPYQRYN